MIRPTHGKTNQGTRIDRRRVVRTGGLLASAAALLKAPMASASNRLAATAKHNQEGVKEMVYQIEGRLLEVCTCNTLCPCWVGEDPDGGTCDASLAYQIDKGTIEGLDVAGRTLAFSLHIPGNILAGNWRVVIYVDDESTDEQQEAMLKVFTGQLGGAAADFTGLIGEVVAVERAPITFTVVEGKGTLRIGSAVDAEMAPFTGGTGATTTLNDTVFSTIPGAPAYPGKATHFRRDGAAHGLSNVDIQGQNAVQGLFHFEA